MAIELLNKPAEMTKTIAELNDSYEAAFIKHAANANVSSTYDIDLAEPFFGTEWGISEWNLQRQKWRWLGPLGQSHLYLKLPTETDHQFRVYIHTAASGQILESLTAFVNGARCAHQGHDWGADGVVSQWFIVTRDLVAKRQGIAKISWSLVSAQAGPQAIEPNNDSEQPAFARMIAFSRLTCEPYPPPSRTKNS